MAFRQTVGRLPRKDTPR